MDLATVILGLIAAILAPFALIAAYVLVLVIIGIVKAALK
jgi:hypothetical protein